MWLRIEATPAKRWLDDHGYTEDQRLVKTRSGEALVGWKPKARVLPWQLRGAIVWPDTGRMAHLHRLGFDFVCGFTKEIELGVYKSGD